MSQSSLYLHMKDTRETTSGLAGIDLCNHNNATSVHQFMHLTASLCVPLSFEYKVQIVTLLFRQSNCFH